jgi:hypothetical protein
MRPRMSMDTQMNPIVHDFIIVGDKQLEIEPLDERDQTVGRVTLHFWQIVDEDLKDNPTGTPIPEPRNGRAHTVDRQAAKNHQHKSALGTTSEVILRVLKDNPNTKMKVNQIADDIHALDPNIKGISVQAGVSALKTKGKINFELSNDGYKGLRYWHKELGSLQKVVDDEVRRTPTAIKRPSEPEPAKQRHESDISITSLYVAGIDPSKSDAAVLKPFSFHGELKWYSIPRHKWFDGKPGYAYIEMDTPNALRAIDKLNNVKLGHYWLSVQQNANPRHLRTSR